MEVQGKAEHQVPLWKKCIAPVVIILVATFAASLFFRFMTSLSDNPEVQGSVFAGWGGVFFGLGVGLLGAVIFVGVQFRRKQVCGIIFDDQQEKLTIKVLNYWSAGIKEVIIPYQRLRFTEAEEETIQGEDSDAIRFYDELHFVGRMTRQSYVWENHPKSYRKIQGKLKRLKNG